MNHLKINRPTMVYTSPKYLWFLMVSYAMMLSISNWYDVRIIVLFGHILTPGTLVFPITFLLSDIITEVYGYKNARRAIWCAFFFNFLFILFGQLVIHLPSPLFATQNKAFDSLFSANLMIIVGSFASYLISEPTNAYIVAKLKIKLQGEYMAIRFLSSTVIAAALDSILFIIIAFGHFYSTSHLANLIINIWLVKVVIEIVGLPFSIKISKKLKKLECIDIYDENTNFSLMRLNVDYYSAHNKFKSKENP